jgi:hypothetical protein
MAISVRAKRGKKGKKASLYKSKKPAGRPKVPCIEGCTVIDGWNKDKHVYQMFGAPQERCVKCGKENPMITRWRARIIENGYEGHPYVENGYWSEVEYKKYMKR